MIQTSRRMMMALVSMVMSASVAGAQNTEPPLDTSYVIYDQGPITLPLGIGLRIPSYNRVDGLALPWGPDIKFGNGRVELAPVVTYRSHIGKFDPEITGKVKAGPMGELRFTAGRSTFSNDRWIKSDIINSLTTLATGGDTRNYFRADRGQVEYFHTIVRPMITFTPSAGALHEFAWSTGDSLPHSSSPWSLFGRTDDLGMRRVNPGVIRGHTTSGLAGLLVEFDDNVTKAKLGTRVEHAFDSPETAAISSGFTQLTVDARSKFPTFGLQQFEFAGHFVFTGGDAPPQRYSYLGGSSTLSTVDQLALGGDRLVFVEGEYQYPLRAPVIQFVGAPILTLRWAAGSAGVGELGDFIHNIGVGISLKVIKAAYHYYPSYKETPFRDKSAFSLSFSLPF
jgi:hypothetical protein